MSHTPPDLAALIGSRICHDLISPIGAINNGLELLGMSGDTTGPELSLISESVESASARIRFFRVAFGAAGDQELSSREVRTVLNDMTRPSKIQVDWAVESSARRTDIRLAFLAEQCLESAMPYGGAISVTREGSDWQLRGSTEKFNVDHALWAILGDGKVPADIAPAHVQFALLAVHCRDDGRALRTVLTPEEITIQF